MYKQIQGYPNYGISTSGEVINLNTGKVIKQFCSSTNFYWTVTLSNNGKTKTFHVHKLVAINHLNHIPCGHEEVVDHIDGDKNNNHVDNLQLITNRQNLSKGRNRDLPTGVYLSSSNRYTARIRMGNETIYLGTYDTPRMASLAYEHMLLTGLRFQQPKTA